MSTIRICDSCKGEIQFSELVQFLGSRVLSDVTFCESCFREVENFVTDRYSISKIQSKRNYAKN